MEEVSGKSLTLGRILSLVASKNSHSWNLAYHKELSFLYLVQLNKLCQLSMTRVLHTTKQ